jgi:uncharacterized protein YneF (UPF0154 family)
MESKMEIALLLGIGFGIGIALGFFLHGNKKA